MILMEPFNSFPSNCKMKKKDDGGMKIDYQEGLKMVPGRGSLLLSVRSFQRISSGDTFGWAVIPFFGFATRFVMQLATIISCLSA
jgi:hypothetical protein